MKAPNGAIKKEYLIRWVKEAGANEVDTVIPASMFRVLKS
jgi:hypothetical protein